MPIPVISVNDLPEFDDAVAIYGARQESGPAIGAMDDAWLVAVIMVYDANNG
ncbi:MAG: hypothetical protein R3E02_15660 [Blastomonas sp.]